MSIKYNERGEVVSVNGLTTGHHIGAPMQDAIAEKPEDNMAYCEEVRTVTRCKDDNDELQPKPSYGGGVSPEEVTTIVKEQFPGGVGYEEFNPIVIAEEQTAVNDGENGFAVNGTGLVAGENYIVTLDGVEYERTALSGEDMAYIGDFPFGGSDPFYFAYANDFGFIGVFTDSAEHTFKITTGVKQYKIDKKFLPDDFRSMLEVPILRLKLSDFNLDDLILGGSNYYQWDARISYEQIVAAAKYGGLVLYDAEGTFAVTPQYRFNSMDNRVWLDVIAGGHDISLGISADPPHFWVNNRSKIAYATE